MSVAAVPPSRITRLAYGLPALLALVGAALLIVQWAHGRMLWLDEEMIALNIRDRSFGQLAGRLSFGQAAPYGWLAVQRAILIVAGSGERALRFLPMAFGIATLTTAFWVGRRWMSVWGAAALVFLCAFGQWVSFHSLELKHYSADVCFGLLVPALAVWATESSSAGSLRRTTIWWIVAAGTQWLSNGALFVTPFTAAVLMLVHARRSGARGVLRAVAPSAIWLVSFAANYLVTLEPARSNRYLQQYWAWAFPQAGSGAAATLRWLGGQLAPLAVKPGGSGFVFGFWVAAAIGFLIGRPRSSRMVFRSVFAMVPVAAFAWTAIRLVPMSERLTLWMVPAVYVGIALAFDVAVTSLSTGVRLRQPVRVGIAVLATGAFVVFFADEYTRGVTYVNLAPKPDNHELDDRGAVNWLARQQQPGDVWITTYNALPAVWWYAPAAEEAPVLEASLLSDPTACGDGEITKWLTSRGRRRVLVYFGFGHDSAPDLDAALLTKLGEIGHVVGYRRFSLLGHAVIVEIGRPSSAPVTLASLMGKDSLSVAPVKGCVVVRNAKAW